MSVYYVHFLVFTLCVRVVFIRYTFIWPCEGTCFSRLADRAFSSAQGTMCENELLRGRIKASFGACCLIFCSAACCTLFLSKPWSIAMSCVLTY